MNASQTRRCARHAGLAVLLLSALWLGLPAQAQTLECDATGAGTEPPTDLCLTAESADTPWRYVGITNGAQCPPSPSWTTSRLFAPSGDGVIPPGLRAFCLYEAATDVPNVEELMLRRCDAPEPPPTCLSSLDPDAAAMALMGSDLSSVIWEPLREHFLEQVGYVGALPTVAPNTRLAVIDTEPTGPGDDPQQARTSRHGFTLVSLIRDVLCDGSRACAVEVQAQLGLPLVRCPSVTGFCRNEAEGGYVGTIGDLAMAIRQQVENWGASGVDNLIINLSVAWDPRFGGEAPISNSRVAAQAVYRALQDARCRGAIIVAAAGNRISGPDANVGALLPAGWETEAAPDGTTCQNLIGQMPDPVDFAGTYQPLVYAAGAVRTDGSEAETRNDGEPRLVTYGDHAVARLGGAGQPAPSQIYTGSSVAAAVVSAAAAAAWHYRPNAGPAELMDTVYDSGLDVGRQADFCLGGACTFAVRRLGVCQAVDKVCGAFPGATCPALACAPPGGVLRGLPEDDIDALFLNAPSFDVAQLTKATALDVCRPGLTVFSLPGSELTDPCPARQYHGVQATPWTDGQPEGQFCPNCLDRFHSPGKLFLEVDAALEGTLSRVTLLCGDDGYRIPGQLVAGDRRVIENIPEPCEFEELAVTFRVDNGTGSPASLASASLSLPDRDDDGVQDGLDNCVNDANADQLDADGDGIGNLCDGDFNNDCDTNFLDLGYFKQNIFTTDPVADMNGDGAVNFFDLGLLKSQFFTAPGLSGIDNLCSGQ